MCCLLLDVSGKEIAPWHAEHAYEVESMLRKRVHPLPRVALVILTHIRGFNSKSVVHPPPDSTTSFFSRPRPPLDSVTLAGERWGNQGCQDSRLPTGNDPFRAPFHLESTPRASPFRG